MYCNYCGKVIPDDAHLCAYCGKRLTGVVARRRLVRPRNGRKIAGVCLGFAEYFDLDCTWLRVVGLGWPVFGLVGFLPYMAPRIGLPKQPRLRAAPKAHPQKVENEPPAEIICAASRPELCAHWRKKCWQLARKPR